jgi:hypothetical protein
MDPAKLLVIHLLTAAVEFVWIRRAILRTAASAAIVVPKIKHVLTANALAAPLVAPTAVAPGPSARTDSVFAHQDLRLAVGGA